MTSGRTLTIGIGTLLIAAVPANAASVGFAVYEEVDGAPQGNSVAQYDSTSIEGEGLCVPGAGMGLCYVLGDPTATLTTTPQSSASGLLAYSMTLSAVGSTATSSGSLAGGLTGIDLSSGSGAGDSTETEIGAGVSMEDGVTLSVAGGGPIDVGVDFSLTGTAMVPVDASYVQSVLMSLGTAQLQWGAFINGANSGSSASVIESGTENWTSYMTPVLTPTSLEFQGMATVTSGQDLQFILKQQVNCNAGASCDFLDPGQITLILPPGVTMTSDSGVFLSAATPEPEEWGVTAGCLALLVLAARRKRAITE